MNDIYSMLERVQALRHSRDVEIVTHDGRSLRGTIDNLRSTQPFSKPAVKLRTPDGKITKILFSEIKEMIDHAAKSE
jgi:uncharacterized protein (UPF0218 family)